MKKHLFATPFFFRVIVIVGLLCYGSFTFSMYATPTDSTWQTKGFDFHISGGIYMAGKHAAMYYSGAAENENNLNYIFGNKYYYDQINEFMLENNPEIGDSVFLGTLPSQMTYKPALSISLGFRYKFNRHWGLSMTYYFAKLTASNTFLLKRNGELGNKKPMEYEEYLVGKESRSFIDLTASYLFHPHPIIKPFIEMGVQFNYARVNKFIALFRDEDSGKEKEFDLLNIYPGQSYIPNTAMTEEKIVYGGAGYGFSFAAGLKLAINNTVSIDPTFYFSAGSIGLNGYKSIDFHYGAYVRIVMSDLVFKSR
ncbi:MAG: hypothetical protein LBR51_03630 [Bacteroidales bacterium]|nr:hypothetical protein [Bacteroidales bacterium]